MKRLGKLLIAPLLVSAVAVGCASLPNQVVTRPPDGRSASDVARDEAQCEAYGKAHEKHRGDHYQSCMLAKSYAANVDMDHLGWTIGVVQTQPHDAEIVLRDMRFCDSRADNAKNSDVVKLSPEQERSIGGQNVAGSAAFVPGMAYQQRPNASRMLVSCLSERGYSIVPWVPVNAPR